MRVVYSAHGGLCLILDMVPFGCVKIQFRLHFEVSLASFFQHSLRPENGIHFENLESMEISFFVKPSKLTNYDLGRHDFNISFFHWQSEIKDKCSEYLK